MELKGNNRKISENSMKESVKKKLLKRGRKVKRSPMDDMGKATSLEPHYIGYNRSSLASSLNWSVPSNLPEIVSEMPRNTSHPTSLENITFNLEMQSSMESMHASNPDIIHEHPTQRDDYNISRSPSSAGPETFDVGVQVEARRPVFMYPTPPNSVSPTLPPDTVLVSTSSHSTHSHTHSKHTPIRHFHAVTAHDMHDVTSYHSSSSSLDNRYSTASFPFVPEEDDECKLNESKDESNSFEHSGLPITVSAPNIQVRLLYVSASIAVYCRSYRLMKVITDQVIA